MSFKLKSLQSISRYKKLLTLFSAIAFALLLLILLTLTDFILQLWQRLANTPGWFIAIYALILGVFVGVGLWFLWRILRKKKSIVSKSEKPFTEEELKQRISSGELAGVDIKAVIRELDELQKRRQSGEVYIALLGDISSGKSSLIKALLPMANVEIDPRGGTTKNISHHIWTSSAGDRLILTDLPGLNEACGHYDHLTREEALRSHVIIYLCDGDLTRTQFDVVKAMLCLKKPMIIALNKIDQLKKEEIALIQERLKSYLLDIDINIDIVSISTACTREITKVNTDGTEVQVIRDIKPNIKGLAQALQRNIDGNLDTLNGLRDASVFILASDKLDKAVQDFRQAQAHELTSSYSKKAIVGAMAAVAPGSDIIIQGYLGYNLVKELCEIYEVPARKIDVQRFLQLATKHVGKTLPLMLAISGNILKAFPGFGTMAGGLMHAVAYGLIFESMGKAVAATLESRGELAPFLAIQQFEDDLAKDIEKRAKKYAKIAMEEARQKGA